MTNALAIHSVAFEAPYLRGGVITLMEKLFSKIKKKKETANAY
ncbi:hypothetical protein [Vreelandella sp. H-I2]